MITMLMVVAAVLIVSMHCSLFEAVLYSTRRSELEAAIERGEHVRLARALLEMKKTIAAPLASILILNTIANTAGASVAGALVNSVLGPAWLPWFSLALTGGILVFSEIVPKTMGAVYWRSLWPFIVLPLKVMNWVLYPAVRLSLWVSRLFMGAHRGTQVTEEEILALVRIGAREGQISDMESRMVSNIIELENRTVKEIMTPRTVLFVLHADTPVEEAYEEAYNKGFSRIPVHEGSLEDICGYVLLKDLAGRQAWETPQAPIRKFMKPVTFVPDTLNCFALLRRFLKRREHIAVVVDEYGGISGLVTLEDLIETIIGEEIVDETDRVVDMQEQARQKRRAFLQKEMSRKKNQNPE